MTTQELLDYLDKDSVIEILEDLGSPCFGTGATSDGVSYLKFRTICHNGDSEKLWWYENSKQFYCYTCCGSMSIFNLVMKVRGYTFKESFNYIAKMLGVSTVNSSRHGFQDPEALKQFNLHSGDITQANEINNEKPELKTISKFYDQNILNYFDANAFYQGWLDEGITEETMRKFNIRFHWLEGHIIIPHYDINGNLVGIRRRSLNPEDAKNKYMPEYVCGTMYEHPLALNFYGLYENQAALRKYRTAIIFEGEKSVMLSNSYFGDRSIALATCGFNISDWQIHMLLYELKINKVYIGFDKDFDILKENEYKKDKMMWDNYLHYKKRLEVLGQRLGRDGIKAYIIYDRQNLLDIKDSPIDKGKEVFNKLLNDAQLIRTD